MTRKEAQFLVTLVYRALDPSRRRKSNDPHEILATGYAWCTGYAIVLTELLTLAGHPWERWTIVAERDGMRESHDVVLVNTDEGTAILDPTLGIVIPYSPIELKHRPEVLRDVAIHPDNRWRWRGYTQFTEPLYKYATMAFPVAKSSKT